MIIQDKLENTNDKNDENNLLQIKTFTKSCFNRRKYFI